MLTSIFTSYLTSDPNGTRTHGLLRDRQASYSSRLWGRIKHISLARTHMLSASADCSFLPHLCQCRNAAQNVIRCYFSLLGSSFHPWVMSTATLLSKPLPNILSSPVAHKTSLLFVTLHVSITLYEVCRVFFHHGGWPSIILQVGFEPTLHRS